MRHPIRRETTTVICALLLVSLFEVSCQGRVFHRAVHGPMVGHTTSEEALIWIRTGYPTIVRVRFGLDPSRLTQLSEVARTGIDGDYTGVMRLRGLRPDQRYYYRVEATEGVISRQTESFRTPPRTGGLVRIAFGSCMRFEDLSIFDAVLKNDPHLLLLLGDNGYSDTADVPSIQRSYRWFRERPYFEETLARTPTLAIWDDHDFLGNNTDGTRPGKEGSLRAFRQYWANPSYGLPGTPGVFFKTRFGDVEIFMLDGRYNRRVEPGSMLGTAQREWLLRSLRESTAAVKILASGSSWGSSNSSDSWAAFRSERDQIFDLVMRESIGGVILIAGDIHRPAVFRHEVDQANAYPLYELISSPLSNNVRSCGSGQSAGMLFCKSVLNFGLLHIDTRRQPATITYELRGPKNIVHYRLQLRVDQLQTKTSHVQPPRCGIDDATGPRTSCRPILRSARR